MAAASAARRAVSGAWSCLSAHVPAADVASMGNKLLPLGRSSTAAGVIGQQLLVFSGENTPRIPIDNALHCFDLQKRSWSAVTPTAGSEWPCARVGHAGAVAGSNFYVSGGRTGAVITGDTTLADLWKWAPSVQKWEQLKPKGQAPPPLSYHTITGHGSTLYAFGGCTADHGRSNGLWALDTTRDEWTELFAPNSAADNASVPCSRGGPGLAASRDAVWVAFGYNGEQEQRDLWRFDLASRTWERKGPSAAAAAGSEEESWPEARSVTDLVLLEDYFGAGNDALFCFGGEFTPSAAGHEGAGQYHADAWVFDVAQSKWSRVDTAAAAGEAPCARGWFPTLRGPGNSVVVYGGFDGDQRRNDVVRWTPTA